MFVQTFNEFGTCLMRQALLIPFQGPDQPSVTSARRVSDAMKIKIQSLSAVATRRTEESAGVPGLKRPG
jgi:hypothetical protein